jgi:hypothetical protein
MIKVGGVRRSLACAARLPTMLVRIARRVSVLAYSKFLQLTRLEGHLAST